MQTDQEEVQAVRLDCNLKLSKTHL